jgi:hypothetical protein
MNNNEFVKYNKQDVNFYYSELRDKMIANSFYAAAGAATFNIPNYWSDDMDDCGNIDLIL